MALESFDLPEDPEPGSDLYWHETAQPLDLSKAHSTLRQFYRDWSEEGFNAELRPILNLIMSDLDLARHQDSGKATSTHGAEASCRDILLPGAGLGRLVFELSLLGFNAEGNEISYHQLFASQFVLNNVDRADQYNLYPFLSSFNNNVTRSRQLHYVTIPNVHPATVLTEKIEMAGQHANMGRPGQMSMTAGDFITSYSSPENESSFDAVVTLYFIDTAPNVIRYLETIHHCLRDGGVWINVGPLLWHFEDLSQASEETRGEDKTQNGTAASMGGIAEPGSVELSEEEVLQLAQWVGFEVVLRSPPNSEIGGYIRDSESLMHSSYKCCHWVLKKRGKQ